MEEKMTKPRSSYPEIKDISKDLKTLKSDVTSLANHIKEDGLNDLSDRARDGYDRMQAFGKKVEKRIKDEPVKSLAVAFVGGLVFSALFGRR